MNKDQRGLLTDMSFIIGAVIFVLTGHPWFALAFIIAACVQ